MRNPFQVGLLVSGRQFADRDAEVERMVRAFSRAGAKLVVYGDSRMGKTSALERAAEVARQRRVPVAVASLATASEPVAAAQRLLAAVFRELGVEARWLIERVADRLQLTIEAAPWLAEDNDSPLKILLNPQSPDATTRLIPELLDALDAELADGRHAIGLGLDEFQRLLEWGGEPAEWALRDSLARHEAIGYVLVGSRRAFLEALVTDRRRAFWQLAEALPFGPLSEDRLASWITQQAARTGVTIPVDASRLIARLTRARTRDVVQLARAVWFDIYTKGATDPYLLIQEAFERTVREQSAVYELLWQKLDARERAVLQAFAVDPEIRIMAAESSRRFGLGPKSSVYSTVERLVEAEYLARPCPGRYLYDDPFFRRWVQLNGLPDIGEAPPPLLPASEASPVRQRVRELVAAGPAAPGGWRPDYRSGR